MNNYFFDTYAFLKIIEGTQAYDKYRSNVGIITTRLQLMELYYSLLRDHGIEYANRYYDRLVQFAVELDDETVKQAMQFRLNHAKRSLSYVDCIGYVMARHNNVPFLTGDKQFEDFPNVEYVK